VKRTEQQRGFDAGYWAAVAVIAAYVGIKALIRKIRRRHP